ncbi:murein hydrolase activator EnvC family protein [Acidaminococcus fermentans]|uniref:Peptidase M23 n=2 Tax=Acidaminococcus fermentans TaxID=905 RepID=D2RJ01_ACIFV|nr:peptidoglycan DD-metalloendopeptidase family protein [Acidaminococcus fermentans]ADB47053.1 Peptidase M23 [Acidaminococcus fermentans DSM 20731]MCF0139813.1 peptidoglycan DD-metalloendopeptidase family protein [Acidaminococcus fermentans]MCI7195390.1 peptidoglycan DD-metalloendopeptidase family protein [Acidaminococcus fermentans]MDD7196389.1 peptidoglycan DD-metalloendopeptidase family protein [Acidaminococcus fermentans]MEE0338372.1 peptidoglycan DD-metalloendopeptidase family protein [Ac
MKKCAALVAALLLGTQLSASVSWAETIEEKRAQLDEIQQKLGEKDAQLEDKKKEISNAMERLILTQEELAEAKRKLAAIESRQQALSIKIRQNEAALAAKQKEYDKSRSVYKKRLRDIYENGQVNYLDVLLGAADFRDFSSRMYLLQRVIRRDFALIDRLEEQREALLQQKAELDDIRKQLAAAHAESQKEKEIVAQKTVERQKLYEQALAEKAQLDAEYEELQRNSQEITAMIQRMEQEGRMMPQAGGTGQLAWPVNGEITSPFGWRVHPIWGTQIFHAGLDIGADYGDPVHAADSGTVVFAGWMGGYGNAVMIDHGGGMVTLYGHNSSITVGEGEQVSKGQTIALAGSTGNSTGPHCHFEVRIHGEVVSPLQYLP